MMSWFLCFLILVVLFFGITPLLSSLLVNDDCTTIPASSSLLTIANASAATAGGEQCVEANPDAVDANGSFAGSRWEGVAHETVLALLLKVDIAFYDERVTRPTTTTTFSMLLPQRCRRLSHPASAMVQVQMNNARRTQNRSDLLQNRSDYLKIDPIT